MVAIHGGCFSQNSVFDMCCRLTRENGRVFETLMRRSGNDEKTGKRQGKTVKITG